MNRSLINCHFGLRYLIRWLNGFLLLFNSGGFVLSGRFVLSLESSGTNVGSCLHASATAGEKQSVQEPMSGAAQMQISPSQPLHPKVLKVY
jgi:hypothetical protein